MSRTSRPIPTGSVGSPRPARTRTPTSTRRSGTPSQQHGRRSLVLTRVCREPRSHAPSTPRTIGSARCPVGSPSSTGTSRPSPTRWRRSMAVRGCSAACRCTCSTSFTPHAYRAAARTLSATVSSCSTSRPLTRLASRPSSRRSTVRRRWRSPVVIRSSWVASTVHRASSATTPTGCCSTPRSAASKPSSQPSTPIRCRRAGATPAGTGAWPAPGNVTSCSGGSPPSRTCATVPASRPWSSTRTPAASPRREVTSTPPTTSPRWSPAPATTSTASPATSTGPTTSCAAASAPTRPVASPRSRGSTTTRRPA